nr:hypothetical protein GCM10020063_090830 [Dactylosporangium thailandense]
MAKFFGRGRPAMVGMALILLGLGTAGGWALHTLFGPPPSVLESPDYTLVTAAQGEVEQAIRLNASAHWSPTAILPNAAAGTVTTVALSPGAPAGVGAILYTVDLRPVVVATGSVPAFRDLHSGDSGADVVQLQQMLNHLGFPAGTADGKFDATVTAAVKKWQRKVGITPDGSVRHGDVIYVQQLPARLALDSKLVVGAHVAGGEPTLEVLAPTPAFKIDLPENQSRLVSAGMAVEIQAGSRQWKAKIAEVAADDKGARSAQLTSADGGAICQADCTSVKIGGETLLPSRIWIVPPTSGVTVPSVALVTDASGSVGVVLESGVVHAVTVVVNANGTAVVQGLDAGEVVRAPGKPSAR